MSEPTATDMLRQLREAMGLPTPAGGARTPEQQWDAALRWAKLLADEHRVRSGFRK